MLHSIRSRDRASRIPPRLPAKWNAFVVSWNPAKWVRSVMESWKWNAFVAAWNPAKWVRSVMESSQMGSRPDPPREGKGRDYFIC